MAIKSAHPDQPEDQPAELDAAHGNQEPNASPLRSVHTESFAALLKQLQVSVIVSTYQAGFLIVLRHDGAALNTHFRRCERPMGLAASGSRLAVGAAREIVQYRNMADVASKVAGPQPHDACYLPREVHITGDIDIHEMAWGDESRVASPVSRAGQNFPSLSMPHSPRWYDGDLWLAESGDGSLGTVDLARGKYEAVVRLDGFTRGLDFVGPYAFVGISQVRESAVFSGIPITQRLTERICGISVVDLRNGHEVGFVRFQDAVQEIFAVQVVPHRFPEVLEFNDELLSNSYALPDEALADVAWVAPREEPAKS